MIQQHSLYTRRNAGLRELSNLQDDEGKQPSRRGTREHFGCRLTYSSSTCIKSTWNVRVRRHRARVRVGTPCYRSTSKYICYSAERYCSSAVSYLVSARLAYPRGYCEKRASGPATACAHSVASHSGNAPLPVLRRCTYRYYTIIAGLAAGWGLPLTTICSCMCLVYCCLTMVYY